MTAKSMAKTGSFAALRMTILNGKGKEWERLKAFPIRLRLGQDDCTQDHSDHFEQVVA